eukprot:766456-Hanusia_phi.AAC.2
MVQVDRLHVEVGKFRHLDRAAFEDACKIPALSFPPDHEAAARLQDLMKTFHEVVGIPNLRESCDDVDKARSLLSLLERPIQHFDVRKAETCLRKVIVQLLLAAESKQINIAISSILKSCKTPEQQNEIRRIYSSMGEEVLCSAASSSPDLTSNQLKEIVTRIRQEFLQEVGQKLGMQI